MEKDSFLAALERNREKFPMKTRKESRVERVWSGDPGKRAGGFFRRFSIFAFFACFLLFQPFLSGEVLVLKNGRTYRGDIVRWDGKNYFVPRLKILVPIRNVAWISSKKDTDEIIREWWKGIRNRPDLEDALLPLARFCLQEGRLKKGLEFARAWGKFRLWKAYLSREFLILTNARKSLAQAVGRRLDAAMDLFRREFPGGGKKPYGCVVRLFATWNGFYRFAQTLPGKPGTAFYSPAQRMMYLPNTKLETLRWTFSGAYREACAYYLVECLLEYHPRYTWILAGLGSCFETAHLENGKLVGAWKKHPRYGERIRVAIKSRTYTPLETFFRLKAGDFAGGDAYEMHYAQAWSLAWFLHESEKPAYREALFRYLKVLEKEKDDEKALAAAFRPLGWKRLERDWMAFFGAKPPR